MGSGKTTYDGSTWDLLDIGEVAGNISRSAEIGLLDVAVGSLWCPSTIQLKLNSVKRFWVQQHNLSMRVREYGEVCLASTDGVQRRKLHNIFNFPSCEKMKVMASSNIPSRKDAHTWEKVFTSRCNGEIDL